MLPFMAPMMMQGAAGGPILKPQDVHTTTLYTSAGESPKTITGLPFTPERAHQKGRNSTEGHYIFSSVRGPGNVLQSQSAGSEISFPTQYAAFGDKQFADGGFNDGTTVVTWLDKQAPKYLQIRTFTHTTGTADTFDMAVLGVVGEVTIKRTDATGDWYVWHRSLTTGNNLRLNTTAAQSTASAFISVSGTTVTFAAGAPSGTYYLEAWAHDPDTTNGIIQCGSFTTDADGTAGTVTLGWPPQHLQSKVSSAGGYRWEVLDTVRGWAVDAAPSKVLYPNLADAESSDNPLARTSTGFVGNAGRMAPSKTYIFRAIRAAY